MSNFSQRPTKAQGKLVACAHGARLPAVGSRTLFFVEESLRELLRTGLPLGLTSLSLDCLVQFINICFSLDRIIVLGSPSPLFVIVIATSFPFRLSNSWLFPLSRNPILSSLCVCMRGRFVFPNASATAFCRDDYKK